MKRRRTRPRPTLGHAALLCLVMLGLAATRAPAAPADSPIGLWKTFDDKSGQARALVRITEHDGAFSGRIERTLTPGSDTRVCIACTDERKNQPIVGLLIIRNLRAEGGGYVGGDILDPESGAVYRCKLHLEQGGSQLVVRGYIGFALLGRSQRWQRQD